MEYFESVDFINSLLTQKKNDLSLILTLLSNTSMFGLLSSTVSDKFKKTNDTFQKKIAEEAKAYANLSEEDTTIQIILTLNKILGVSPVYYATKRDLYENGEQITNRVAPTLRAIDSKFKGTTYDEFMKYQYMKLFKQSIDQIEDLSDEEHNKFINDIKAFIDSLPKDQQERLKKEIGVDELTQEAIRKSILNGSFGIGFASVVGIGGFPIYMAAASLISTVFGVVGITLPFAFYTGMSSFIAVLASPLFLIPALGLGGFLLFKGGKDKLNKMLALIVITQIAMANDIDENKKLPNRGNEVVAYWDTIAKKYNGFRRQLDNVNLNLKKSQLYDDELQKSYQLKMKQKNELQDVLTNNRSDLKKWLVTMGNDDLAFDYYENTLNTRSLKIIEYKKQLHVKQLELIKFQSAYKNNPKDKNLLSEYKKIQKECSLLQKNVDGEISAFVMEIDKKAAELNKLNIEGFIKTYIIKFTQFDKQLNEAEHQVDRLKSNLNESKQKLAQLRAEVKGIEEQINVLNKQYYGIEKVHHFQEG